MTSNGNLFGDDPVAPPDKPRRRSGRSIERDKAKLDSAQGTCCVHFTMRFDDVRGGRRPGCALGIDVRALVGGPDFGWRQREPCVTSRLSEDQVKCDRFEPEPAK